ncbi:hypothetical protein [Ramlibacter humi]|uniref:Lipoprotein n=1 Tax=Ramlibacter humi TaxID=2530451 RepID=A0A4Z0CA42_9BURK|nr:hypothetical protein [Ramlibacter humi]TFZ08537.1 hypothetical protein EZ216_05105 [Ramlibacter humi]
MKRLSIPAALGATLLALGGCAAPYAVDYNRVSVRDQHFYMPGLNWDPRPTAVVTAGPDGMLVGRGGDAPAAAVAVVMQDGQARLVSQQTLASMNQQGTGAMGSAPAPATPAPAR